MLFRSGAVDPVLDQPVARERPADGPHIEVVWGWRLMMSPSPSARSPHDVPGMGEVEDGADGEQSARGGSPSSDPVPLQQPRDDLRPEEIAEVPCRPGDQPHQSARHEAPPG